jgi:hypothetical protein
MFRGRSFRLLDNELATLTIDFASPQGASRHH